MDKEQVKALLIRYAEGRCTPEEAAQVEAWYLRVAKQQEDPFVDADYAHLYAAAHERLMQALPGLQSPEKPVRSLKWLPYVAAAVVLVLVSVAYFFRSHQPHTVESEQTLSASSILPGGNRATLTIAGGQTVQLDSNQAGILMDKGRVVYTDQRSVDGVVLAADDTHEVSIPLELTTPKGGTYQITLPDGTIVWLNAASTLTYPSHFNGPQRVVGISGEGYFAVAKDSKRPFVVKTEGQAIEVLGTEFNITAYDDEPAVKTTLINGGVRIKPTLATTQESVKLNPGEQGVLSGSGRLTTVQVDTNSVTAWKNGRISLTNVSFEELMRQLSRWYNLDIAYEGKVPVLRFEGEMTRDVTLEKVLRFLQDSGLVFALTNDRTLIVKGKA